VDFGHTNNAFSHYVYMPLWLFLLSVFEGNKCDFRHAIYLIACWNLRAD